MKALDMDKALFGIPNMDVYLVIGILLFFIIVEVVFGFFARSKRSKGDWIQEVGSYFTLALVIKPAIVLAVLFIGSNLLPSMQSVLGGYSLLLITPMFLFMDDLIQYWYHRSAHEYPFLWKLHRPHHQAAEMGFFVSYRNAALYYILMPNIWWIGIFTFLGGAKAVAIGLILKQLIIISSHSTVQYDKWLFKYDFLKPLGLLWERIFITPSFHHSHHGKSKVDGISDPNGNFGNMFSIWDQLFGTASFVHAYPTEYGLENDPKEHWATAYLYPAVKSKDPKSELSSAYQKNDTTVLDPTIVTLEKGKNYLYCQCGMSKNQPFCDGTHHGTKHKPLLHTAKRSGVAKFCNCKLSKTAPFCDNSHLNT